jgi:hypothetical protein
MIPLFISVTSTGDIHVSSQKTDTPTGTIVATFRVNSGTALAKLGTLTGSGNASNSALALTNAPVTGKETETCKTK